MADRGHSPAGASNPKEALLEAAQAALEDARRKAALPGRRRGTGVRTFLLGAGIVLFGLSVYILATRPAWFFTPPPPPEAPAIQEASIRLMLVREAARVRLFQLRNGRLPGTLAEAGSPMRQLAYDTSDGTFRLAAQLGARTIRLSPTDSLAAFLGQSFRTISTRGQP